MLKALLLRSKIDKKNKELKALLAQGEDLQKRLKKSRRSLKKRSITSTVKRTRMTQPKRNLKTKSPVLKTI